MYRPYFRASSGNVYKYIEEEEEYYCITNMLELNYSFSTGIFYIYNLVLPICAVNYPKLYKELNIQNFLLETHNSLYSYMYIRKHTHTHTSC